jgi:prepilin-type processing-associated H-X9-DG protein
MEQGNLYYEQTDAVVRRTPIPGYFCPTRRPVTVINDSRAVNDYAGNGGLILSGGGLGNWGDGRNGAVISRGGVGPKVGFNLVSDGGSNTILAGEKALHPDHYFVYSCSDNEGYTSGWDWDIIRWGDRLPVSDRSKFDPPGACDNRFGSAHGVGVNFAFVDGSVHFITQDVDLTVFQNACQRDDGAGTMIHQ